jgi:hypothetical protein
MILTGKKTNKRLIILWVLLITAVFAANAQIINSAYVKALYKKYPTVKSNFCPACKLWVNPYYKSIADTQRHMPLVEYQYLSKDNYAKTATVKLPRTGIYAAWHPVDGQVNEDAVYVAANKIARARKDLIAKGHVNAWILNAWCADAAILSDTYTFNAACEDQSQNVGTEIATENLTRELLKTTDVKIWGGTFGSQGTFTDGKVTNTYPAFYWKIIDYNSNGVHQLCYWMPNLITEKQNLLPKRVITLQQLTTNLGFDPTKILN